MTIKPPIQVSQSAPSVQKGTRNKLPPVDHYFLTSPTDFLDSFKTPFPFKTPCCTYNLPSPQTIYIYTHTHTHPLPIITYQSETSLPFNQPTFPSSILNRVKGKLTPIFRPSRSWCSIPAHPIILVGQFPVSF